MMFVECPIEYTRQTLRHSVILLFPVVNGLGETLEKHGYLEQDD